MSSDREAQINEAIRTWAWGRFLMGEFPVHDHKRKHLQRCPEAEIGYHKHDAECMCYSEYTRDDVWRVELYIDCPHGIELKWEHKPQSNEGLPDILEEIRETDIKLYGCPHE